MVHRQLLEIILFLILCDAIKCFHIIGGNQKRLTIATSFQQVKHELPSYLTAQPNSNTALFATAGGGKKKRRRRKKPTPETTPIEEKPVELETSLEQETTIVEEKNEPTPLETNMDETKPMDETKTPTFKFNRDEAIALGMYPPKQNTLTQTLHRYLRRRRR